MSERLQGAARGNGKDDLESQILAARRNPNLNFGKIVLLEELGHGGMGIVYKAWQDDLERLVAVKVMGAHATRDAAQRFLQEARLVSKLRHPGIVAVHELGEKDGRPYFSMDLIEGTGLDRAIRGRKMPVKRLAETLKSVALALDFAHRNGVVHRDIKPANILLDTHGSPFVTDFGLAIDIAGGKAMTVTGAVMGTPAYMAPEQARGRRGKPDPRTDIYSLGAVMFEGLTGVPPVPQGDILSMVKSILEDEPRRPTEIAPQVPRDAETICLKCLCKDPAGRYQSGRELAADLERFLAGEPLSARPASAFSNMSGSLKKRGAALAVAGVVLAAAVAMVALRNGGRTAPPPKTPEEVATEDPEKVRLQAEIEDLKRQMANAKTDEEKRRIEQELAAKATPGVTAETPPNPVVKHPVVARYADLDRRIALMLEGLRFATAAGELSQFNPRDADEELWVSATRDRIAKSEDAWFEGIAARAREHYEKKEYDAAAKAWTEIDQGDAGADRKATAQKEILAATDAAAAATRAAKMETLRARLDNLYECVAELGAKREYAAAAIEIARLGTSLEEDLTNLDACLAVRLASASLDAIPAGADALKGGKVLTSGGEYKLLGANGTQLRVQDQATKAELTVAILALPAETLAKLAEAGGAERQAVGAFWLFEGRVDLAKKSWAGSTDAQRLDAFADRIATLSLAREARAALEALFQAHAKKDWKKCLEILAKKDRFAANADWIAAAERVADIEFDAAPTEKDALFAVAPRKSPLGLEWRFDFREAAQIRDWPMLAWNNFNARGPVGIDWEDGALRLTNAGVRFAAPIEAECRFSIEARLTSFAKDATLALTACGCTFETDGSGAYEVRGPAGDIKEENHPPLETGKTFRLEIQVSKDRVKGLVDGREVVSGALPDPPYPETPRIILNRDVAMRVESLSLTGTIAPLWAEEERARRAQLARAQRPTLAGKPNVLSDGKSLGLMTSPSRGTWEPKEGALLGTSPADNVAADLHYAVTSHRNLRLKFSYAPHSGRCFEVMVRGGFGGTRFLLPTDDPGRWRDVELTAVEDALLCVVDGRIHLAPTGTPAATTAGGIRFWLQTSSASIRNVVLQELRIPAQGADWTVVFSGEAPPAFPLDGLAYDNNQKTISGNGSMNLTPPAHECEFRWALREADNVLFRFEARGQKIFEFRSARDDLVIGVRIRGDFADVLVNGAVAAREVKLPKGTGPVRLHASGRNAAFLTILARPLQP